jgi:hypothetical protein
MEFRRTAGRLVIEMTDQETAAVGDDAADMASQLTTALTALAALRTGRLPRPAPSELPTAHRRHPHKPELTMCNLIIQGPESSQRISATEPTCDLCAAPDLWAAVVAAIEGQLRPRLEGIRDATVRTWARDFVGTHGQLAQAMGVPRATAQSRRNALLAEEPGEWELWACPDAGNPRPLPDVASCTPGRAAED